MACSASDFVKSTIAGTGTVSGPLATVTLTLLPAGTDVRRMREQLARVERRVTQLGEEVSEVTEDDGRRSRVG